MVAGAADISTGSVGSPPMRSANITSYKAETAKPIDSTTSTIYRIENEIRFPGTAHDHHASRIVVRHLLADKMISPWTQ